MINDDNTNTSRLLSLSRSRPAPVRQDPAVLVLRLFRGLCSSMVHGQICALLKRPVSLLNHLSGTRRPRPVLKL